MLRYLIQERIMTAVEAVVRDLLENKYKFCVTLSTLGVNDRMTDRN
jgi:hypothetical protein